MKKGKPISENISAKRGRPALFTKAHYNQMSGTHFEAKSRRQKQNVLYTSWAIEILTKGPLAAGHDFSYLLKPKAKSTILAEIARCARRMGDPSWAVSAASAVCQKRMTTAEATGMLRRASGIGECSLAGLAEEIRRAIRRYFVRHGTMSNAEIAKILEAMALDYKRK